jgi:hypothetical protein
MTSRRGGRRTGRPGPIPFCSYKTYDCRCPPARRSRPAAGPWSAGCPGGAGAAWDCEARPTGLASQPGAGPSQLAVGVPASSCAAMVQLRGAAWSDPLWGQWTACGIHRQGRPPGWRAEHPGGPCANKRPDGAPGSPGLPCTLGGTNYCTEFSAFQRQDFGSEHNVPST